MPTIKTLTKSTLLASFIALAFCQAASAGIFVTIEGIEGDVTTPGFEGTFEATMFDLEDVTAGSDGKPLLSHISFSFVRSDRTLDLLRATLKGQQLASIVVELTETTIGGGEMTLIRYKLDRCFIKSWSTSGDADDGTTEEIAFYYTKIDF